MSAPTLITFADGRNPALEVTFSVEDYLLTVRAMGKLVRSPADDPIVAVARELRSTFAEELVSMTHGRLTVADVLAEDGVELIAQELAVMADDDAESFWWLTTHRLPALSGRTCPSRLVVLTAALLAFARDDPRAVELLQALGGATDPAAVEAADARRRGPHVPSELELELRAIADALDRSGGGGDLYWNEDTRTAVWCLRERERFAPLRPALARLERRLAAVPGVEHVRITSEPAPSPDAAAGEDPSWARLTPRSAAGVR
ncbi:MAG: hypothetical protein QOC64_908 [Solirubrobacteraceae bacterium]|nr:hypothetical protein [Solirubrobacteraceae bacterium]